MQHKILRPSSYTKILYDFVIFSEVASLTGVAVNTYCILYVIVSAGYRILCCRSTVLISNISGYVVLDSLL